MQLPYNFIKVLFTLMPLIGIFLAENVFFILQVIFVSVKRYLCIMLIKIELHHDKTNKMACAPSEDSDQPGHLPLLISLSCARNG